MDFKALQKALKPYVPSWKKYLVNSWGLNSAFADKAALLFLLSYIYRLNPVITSGYRSVQHQQELVNRFKAGDPQVMNPLPPGKSLHNNVNWLGNPDSLAMDMDTNTPETAGAIARSIGMHWAGMKDYVHFAVRGGTL